MPQCREYNYASWRRCPNEGTRERDGSYYCAEHDPVRISQERRNQKQRKENKRDRWKKMEKDRKS